MGPQLRYGSRNECAKAGWRNTKYECRSGIAEVIDVTQRERLSFTARDNAFELAKPDLKLHGFYVTGQIHWLAVVLGQRKPGDQA